MQTNENTELLTETKEVPRISIRPSADGETTEIEIPDMTTNASGQEDMTKSLQLLQKLLKKTRKKHRGQNPGAFGRPRK